MTGPVKILNEPIKNWPNPSNQWQRGSWVIMDKISSKHTCVHCVDRMQRPEQKLRAWPLKKLEKRKSAHNFYSGKVTHQNLTNHKHTLANHQSHYESYLCNREFISEPTTKRLSKKIRHSFDDTEEDFLSILNTYK